MAHLEPELGGALQDARQRGPLQGLGAIGAIEPAQELIEVADRRGQRPRDLRGIDAGAAQALAVDPEQQRRLQLPQGPPLAEAGQRALRHGEAALALAAHHQGVPEQEFEGDHQRRRGPLGQLRHQLQTIGEQLGGRRADRAGVADGQLGP